MLKKIILGIITLVFLLPLTAQRAEALNGGDVSAKAAVLMCANTGEVLFSKNANTKLSMASTTKIMTSILALESLTPELNITISEEMLKVEGTSMGLLPGDSVTLRNLVYGMLLQSGNDAANVTAYVLGGSPEGFAVMMNEKAREIGMKNTNFVTPSGLDADEHYSTAYDMALLAQYAIKNPEFVSVCSKVSVRVSYGNPPYLRTLSNHNRLLYEYEGCFGIKTGFTKKSGRCLVSAAERDGVTLICVTLNASDDWNDHKKMFDYGFSAVNSVDLPCQYSDIELNVVGGTSETVGVEAAYQPKAVFGTDIPEVENVIYLKRFEYAPIEKGSIVGYSTYLVDGAVVEEVPLVAVQDIEQLTVAEPPQEESFWGKITDYFSERFSNK